jgi:hypothetical protein
MRLACVTVPNFRIALERARAPRLAGISVAIGEPPPGTNDVLDCSPEAAALGVRTGMPLRDARTLAPDLVVLPPDPVFYARSFESMLDALAGAEPAIEAGDDGVAFAAIYPAADVAAQQRAAEPLVHAITVASSVLSSVCFGEV